MMYLGDFYISWILVGTTATFIVGCIFLIANMLIRKSASVVGLVLALFAAVVGYGAMCVLIPVRVVSDEITDYEVAFTTSTVTLAFDDYAEVYYDAKTYNILSNKSEAIVYYEIEYNSYNVNIDAPVLRISKQ